MYFQDVEVALSIVAAIRLAIIFDQLVVIGHPVQMVVNSDQYEMRGSLDSSAMHPIARACHSITKILMAQRSHLKTNLAKA